MNKNENNREMKFERKGRFWSIKEKNAKNIIYRQQFEKKEISFCEVLHLWLENNRLKLKPQSYADYKFMIDSHISPIIGSIPITRINVNCINSFLYEKSKNGRLDGK